MSKRISAVKGMNDVLAPGITVWHQVENIARQIFGKAAYTELRTPILEDINLFERGIGEATDIVEKEMYTLLDRNDKKLALRPEGTASVVRAFIDHFASHGQVEKKFYYFGPMFRYERPQAGRLRQFYQFGAEAFGSDAPGDDAELLSLISQMLASLGITQYELHLNSLGNVASRQAYRDALLLYLKNQVAQLCEKCISRMERNPLRVLDCKNPSCIAATEQAPMITDHLDESSRSHFQQVQHLLKIAGVTFKLNPRLVRGLDYYEKTAFEFVSNNLGAQNAFAGGGRYNGLVEDLGGPSVPAIGFAFGMERLVSLLGEPVNVQPKLLLLPLGDAALQYLFPQLPVLRQQLNCVIEMEHSDKALKAKLKTANRINAQFVLILGEQEMAGGNAVLKNMSDSSQQQVPLINLSQHLAGLFNK